MVPLRRGRPLPCVASPPGSVARSGTRLLAVPGVMIYIRAIHPLLVCPSVCSSASQFVPFIIIYPLILVIHISEKKTKTEKNATNILANTSAQRSNRRARAHFHIGRTGKVICRAGRFEPKNCQTTQAEFHNTQLYSRSI